jgi:hypothetical protein
VLTRGDSILYYFIDEKGVLFARGTGVAVQHDRLVAIADSVERDLTATYGEPVRCRPEVHDPRRWMSPIGVERYLQWIVSDTVVQFFSRAGEGDFSSRILFERATRGYYPCYHWLGVLGDL